MTRMMMVVSWLVLATGISSAQESAVPKLTGPYLGQKPPETTPEVFAPGIVSRDGGQYELLMASDHHEIIFCERESAHNTFRLISITSTDGQWSAPTAIPFSLDYINNEPTLSPDGKRLFFVSNRPIPPNKEAEKLPDIWVSEKVDGRWGEPRNVGAPVNTPDIEVQPYCPSDSILYFCRQAEGVRGIYQASFAQGRFSSPVLLDLDTALGRISGPCISPDNTTLIVHAMVESGANNWDLFVSFRDRAGKWGKFVSVGASINTEKGESDATFSPDGKYLFFTREGDIYWVAASVIEASRPMK